MTALASKTRSTNTRSKQRSTQARRRKTSWLGLAFILSPYITLSGLGASGALILHNLQTNQPTAIEKPAIANTTIQNTTQPSPKLSQPEALKNTATSATAVQLAPAEFYRLITLSILEAPTPAGRLDVIQVVYNRLHAPQAGLGYYGDTITEITFAPGQFEPYFHLTPEEIVDFDSAVSVLVQERGYTTIEAKAILEQVIANISNPQQMANAREHVGGRTAFKGVTQYAHRIPSEDPLRTKGENFFHIDHGQTYQQLTQLEKLSPATIQLKQSNH